MSTVNPSGVQIRNSSSMCWIRVDISRMVSIANANPVYIPGRLPSPTVAGRSRSSVLIRSRLFSTVRIMRIKLNTNEMKMNQASLPAPSNKTENQKLTFSALELTNSIRNYTCSSLGENLYNFHYTDDVIQSLAKNNSRYLQINMLYLN